MSGSYKPLPMMHPDFQPALKGVSPDPRKGLPGTKGHATRFPPMTATNPDEEVFLRSRGYLPNPKGRLPQMMVDGPDVIMREDSEGSMEMIPITQPAPASTAPVDVSYPRYVGTVRVNSEEEHKALLEATGPDTPLSAPAIQAQRQAPPAARAAPTAVPVAAQPQLDLISQRIDGLEKNVRQIMDAVNGLLEAAKPKPSPATEREALRLEAKALRLKFDGRLSTAQLRELVEKARKPPERPAPVVEAVAEAAE